VAALVCTSALEMGIDVGTLVGLGHIKHADDTDAPHVTADTDNTNNDTGLP